MENGLSYSVLIDPGHGGHAHGAVYGVIQEEDLNLDMGLECGAVLRDLGHDVIFTRDRDIGLPLVERLNMVRKYRPDAFVSIHCNAFPNERARGVETFYRDENDFSLASHVQKYVSSYSGLMDRGVMMDLEYLKKRLTVLNHEPTPSALVEVGFLTNSIDREYIVKNRQTLGMLIAHGIDAFAHWKEGKPKLTKPI